MLSKQPFPPSDQTCLIPRAALGLTRSLTQGQGTGPARHATALGVQLAPVGAGTGAPQAACMENGRGLTCLLACGTSLGSVPAWISALMVGKVSIGRVYFEKAYNLH